MHRHANFCIYFREKPGYEIQGRGRAWAAAHSHSLKSVTRYQKREGPAAFQHQFHPLPAGSERPPAPPRPLPWKPGRAAPGELGLRVRNATRGGEGGGSQSRVRARIPPPLPAPVTFQMFASTSSLPIEHATQRIYCPYRNGHAPPFSKGHTRRPGSASYGRLLPTLCLQRAGAPPALPRPSPSPPPPLPPRLWTGRPGGRAAGGPRSALGSRAAALPLAALAPAATNQRRPSGDGASAPAPTPHRQFLLPLHELRQLPPGVRDLRRRRLVVHRHVGLKRRRRQRAARAVARGWGRALCTTPPPARGRTAPARAASGEAGRPARGILLARRRVTRLLHPVGSTFPPRALGKKSHLRRVQNQVAP
jgi:hypothetical protein